MLVTDIPPATNYSGGIFVNEIVESLEFAMSNLFCYKIAILPHKSPKARDVI